MCDTERDLKVSALDGHLRELGSEFQRTLPEYTWLDLKKVNPRDWYYIYTEFPECLERMRQRYTGGGGGGGGGEETEQGGEGGGES